MEEIEERKEKIMQNEPNILFSNNDSKACLKACKAVAYSFFILFKS